MFDKNKGFLSHAFEKSLEKASRLCLNINFAHYASAKDVENAIADGDLDDKGEIWPRTPGSAETGDQYGYSMKPRQTSKWTRPPYSDEEKSLYHGVHMHSEDNPLGLHTHNPGGPLAGGHSHGPQNRFGVHHHKDIAPVHGFSVDGNHTHEGLHFPDGKHEHCVENFG